MNKDTGKKTASGSSRRAFLKGVGVLSVGAAASAGAAGKDASTDDSTKLPQVPFGRYSLSRLICGANPFNGGSHLSVFVNREMRRYYRPEQILKSLRRCQQVGINCWQGSADDYKDYQRFIDQGGKMHYISLGEGGSGRSATIPALVKAGCIGIAHHGEFTDQLFKKGKLDEIHDYLKQVRDAGLMVGVSTHIPAVVDAVESKGWDIDFYMTCVYERHRSAAELTKLLGQAPIPVGEVYLPLDPPRMFKAVQQTKRTCLVFKILAAGRLSENPKWVENAFRQTFQSIKSNDAVIVGIYDRYSDQAAKNAEFTRKFSKT
ncbi:MAG: hypothetical protein ACYTF1_22240 [Planctomycetota bacterium]|jgi:hypothetical protein